MKNAPISPSLNAKPRTRAACDELTALARGLGEGVQLPTVVELKGKLGVSLTTLNSALSLLEGQGLLRRVHGHGIFVASVAPRIALVCEQGFLAHNVSPFWRALMEAIEDRAESADETLESHFAWVREFDPAQPVAASAAGLNSSLIGDIEAGRVQGIIGIGLPIWSALWLRARNVPFVGFAGMGRGMIHLETANIVRAGVDELARRGCRRLALAFQGAPSMVVLQHAQNAREGIVQTRDEFKARLAVHNLDFAPALACDDGAALDKALESGDLSFLRSPRARLSAQEFGFECVKSWWRLPTSERPDGLVFCHDLCTRGALAALRQLGVVVGRDVQIATHSNAGSPLLMGYEDDLIRVEYDAAHIVSALFEMLEAQMNGREMWKETRVVAPQVRLPAPT